MTGAWKFTPQTPQKLGKIGTSVGMHSIRETLQETSASSLKRRVERKLGFFMILRRRHCLATPVVCLCCLIPYTVVAQQPAPPAQPAPAPPQNKNPFEAVPQSAEPAKPAQPGQTPKPVFEVPKPAEEAKPEA